MLSWIVPRELRA